MKEYVFIILLLTTAINGTAVGRLQLRELLGEIESLLSNKEAGAETAGFDEGPLVARAAQEPSVLIGAFNVQVFGDTKYAKAFVKKHLLKILPRYDVLLIQEIRDSDGNTFLELMEDLNQIRNYDYVISDRLGRTSSKEQYAYIYDPSKFQVETTYQYNDKNDYFEREPFGVILTSQVTALPRFGLLGVHTKPTDAPNEISRMADVQVDFSSQHNIQDVVMMGDFNGDCSYVTSKEWKTVKLRTDSKYTWWIEDNADTTVAPSSCAYDRIVSTGTKIKRAIVPGSVAIYRFDEVYGLSPSEASDISDHYPVEFRLYGKLSSTAEAMSVKESFSVTGEVNFIDYDDVTGITGFETEVYEQSGTPTLAILRKNGLECTAVPESLQQLMSEAPSLLTAEVAATTEAYLETGILDQVHQVPGNLEDPSSTCDLSLHYKDSTVTVYVSRATLGK